MTATLTDGQLLRDFALSRDQRAFHELVQRHQDMVFSTALRRTGRRDLAADVAQNVFLALATKAAWLSTRATVGGWLYKSTLLETARRQRDEARRSHRERRYAEDELQLHDDPNAMTDEDESNRSRHLMPMLDEAMSGLSQRDREALVLRFMRGLSLRDTGAALGTTEEAARKRVARALEKLSSLFRRRGATASAALLAGTLLPEAVKAAPAGLTEVWAGVATSAPATGLWGAVVLKAASLGKIQVLATGAAVALIPISWQAMQIRKLQSENATLAVQLSAQQKDTVRPDLAALVRPTGPPSSAGPPEVAAKGLRGGEKRENNNDRRGRFERWRELQRQQQREARLAALHEQIGLEDYQLTAIGEATVKAETALQALAEQKGPGAVSGEGAVIAAARDKAIAAVLDAAQWEEYEAFCRGEERGQREVLANRLLGDIQNTLHLSDPQKDLLFALFASGEAEFGPLRSSFPVELMTEAQTGKLAGILSEEQFRLWQERTVMWRQLFGARDKGGHREEKAVSP